MGIQNYYNKLSQDYFYGSDELASYHNMRVSTSLSLLKSRCSGKVFDFACGSGEVTKILQDHGFNVSGCDISESMVNMANTHLGHDCISLGGMECLADIKQMDLVVALNILPYLSESDEKEFFSLSRSALKKNGYLLLSHTNSLFDMLTFNKYTVAFWNENFIKPFSNSDDEHQDLLTQFRSLLTDPAQPNSNVSSWKGNISVSEREILAKRRVDPFEYSNFIEQLGFKVEAFIPINCFPLPPSIIERNSELIKRQHRFHSELKNKTLARLLCSQFQVLCKRI